MYRCEEHGGEVGNEHDRERHQIRNDNAAAGHTDRRAGIRNDARADGRAHRHEKEVFSAEFSHFGSLLFRFWGSLFSFCPRCRTSCDFY